MVEMGGGDDGTATTTTTCSAPAPIFSLTHIPLSPPVKKVPVFFFLVAQLTAPLVMAIATPAIFLLLLMLAFLLLLFLLLCKPWRFLFPRTVFSPAAARSSVKDDIERRLIDDNDGSVPDEIDVSAGSGSSIRFQNKGNAGYADAHDLPINEVSDQDSLVGQTLKRPAVANWPSQDASPTKTSPRASYKAQKTGHGSCITLKVVAGPSSGLHYTVQSTDESQLPLTLGRVPPCGLLINDSEVSGKHAIINWNSRKLRWELTDMGSLNGTQVNSKPINLSYSGRRQLSQPVELADGDLITLGLGSTFTVQLTSHSVIHIPFGVGMASDPMESRRGGKKLPMEDACYFEWSLPAVDQFGLFGVFDGHGGAGAAITASEILPKVVAEILSTTNTRERVLSLCDASEVLRDAFSKTEAAMNHDCEGCTATVLLVWNNKKEDLFAQCANVGDSACIMSISDEYTMLTEDHRIISSSERSRLRSLGTPIRDGETRLCGLNLGRMLGDKFLKEQEPRFSSEPYVSRSVHIPRGTEAFALLASDGLWDVVSAKKAVQLVVQAREKHRGESNLADKVANFVLSEARTLRPGDNTSVIFLDFNTERKL